ncbi:Beta-galactosidase [Flagellimonas maritima]|uniref:Beta-galactosidase n=1 Tax=Flagellimonas maritima TaxID=1383885 RepID=A0A2Z4LR25_9FLAO|nr:family 43 glycosylhydrolase [Allomuricauda aurantiaca]AWX43697.1 Beta-galactosidase [Allomuricauda aurantiaca]
MKVLFRNVISVFLCFYPLLLIAQKITVDNTMPRLDEKGQIVDAHDGRIIQFGDRYYWYGTAYGDTNGFTTKNQYVCYSSSDLKNWKSHGPLLKNQPIGVHYRPHVIYNKTTKNYVLWYNWYPKLWDGQFGVAVSKNPEGPFTIVNDNTSMAHSDIGLGDLGLFVDKDGTAYVSYNTIKDHQVSVEKLSDDYLSSTKENGGFIAKHMEAGAMFKRNGKYYLLTDYTCCFCNYGSGARVYISENPMTRYKLKGNINRYPGKFSGILNDGIDTGTLYETLAKHGDAFDAVEIRLEKNVRVNALNIHLFTGNRRENCGDVSNPRVHPKIEVPSFKVFKKADGEWSEMKITSQNIQKSTLKNGLTLTLETTEANHLKIQPFTIDYSFDEVYVNEVEIMQKDNHKTKRDDFEVFITGKKIRPQPIIPAQQTYVMKLNTDKGEEFIWMGDLWGSASDNIKGHDYQYWSKPLEFYEDGSIKPMKWQHTWSVEAKK